MTSVGRRAALPPAGWRPEDRLGGPGGLVAEFVSEDGTQRKSFDFAVLDDRIEIKSELAEAFIAATGPLGTWKRLKSAQELWSAARRIASSLAVNRPRLRSLAGLTTADARLLTTVFGANKNSRIGHLRGLLRNCSVIDPKVIEVLRQAPADRGHTSSQPYSDTELRWITTAARGLVRRARTRIYTSRQLIADFRDGKVAEPDPRWRLARALDICDRTGDIPRYSTGVPRRLNFEAIAIAGQHNLMTMLHLKPAEVWAFAVLLAATTGLNASVIGSLPTPHLVATTSTEPGIALVDATKPRRGTRSRMTVLLTALPAPLHPAPAADARRQSVLNTSLTTAFGVFNLLLDLTEPTRAIIGSTRAFAFYAYRNPHGEYAAFRAGLPRFWTAQQRTWLRPVLTGDTERDDVLVHTNMNRLRKTFLERTRKPVAHTPATLVGYLRRMRNVTDDGFHIVRQALDEQVANALARRRLTVDTTEELRDDHGQDTILGTCQDMNHSPLDNGGACRQSFLSCLDCGNARAFPRHLPLQLAVLDALNAQHDRVPVERWVAEFAGRVAQLDDVIAQYQQAQINHARADMTQAHRRIAARLITGEFDPQ